MMLNRHYLGDDFYPAIIDPVSFDAVSAELNKRSTHLGRNDRYIAPIISKRTIASTCSYASFSAIIVSHDTESKKLST